MNCLFKIKTESLKNAEIERERRGLSQQVPPRLDEPMLVPIPEEKGVPKLAPKGACGPGTKKESRGTYSHALSCIDPYYQYAYTKKIDQTVM